LHEPHGHESAVLRPGQGDAGALHQWQHCQSQWAVTHQQRMLDEKQETDIRITKLDEFMLRNALFRQLDPEEQSRMRRQLDVMCELSVILGKRIARF
jgi:hypothetical protein